MEFFEFRNVPLLKTVSNKRKSRFAAAFLLINDKTFNQIRKVFN